MRGRQGMAEQASEDENYGGLKRDCERKEGGRGKRRVSWRRMPGNGPWGELEKERCSEWR